MGILKDPAVGLALWFGMAMMAPIIVLVEDSIYNWRRKNRKKKKKLAKLARS